MPKPAPRPAPVVFRPGPLAGALEARQGLDLSLGQVAQRDLERYYQVLADELARIQLSEAEATVIVAACRGWIVEPSSYRYLWANVEDYLRDQVEDAGTAALDQIPRLDAAGRATLVAKLRALSPGGAMALCDAVERYWIHATEAHDRAALSLPGDEHAAMLRSAGLVR